MKRCLIPILTSPFALGGCPTARIDPITVKNQTEVVVEVLLAPSPRSYPVVPHSHDFIYHIGVAPGKDWLSTESTRAERPDVSLINGKLLVMYRSTWSVGEVWREAYIADGQGSITLEFFEDPQENREVRLRATDDTTGAPLDVKNLTADHDDSEVKELREWRAEMLP